jgi:hypothetical protein
MKVVVCTPTITRPYDAYLAALEASAPVLEAAGWEHFTVFEIGSPYISNARATLLRKALDIEPDAIVFLDHDLSWRPRDLLTLIETPGDVVGGSYRMRKPDVEYMVGFIVDAEGRPKVRADGCIAASWAPGGFLKITTKCVDRFMEAYPELACGPRYHPSVDLFNHGADGRVWYGEDIMFSKRWIACGGEIWIVPDLSIDHHSATEVYAGNLHEYLLARPGGSEDPARRLQQVA